MFRHSRTGHWTEGSWRPPPATSRSRTLLPPCQPIFSCLISFLPLLLCLLSFFALFIYFSTFPVSFLSLPFLLFLIPYVLHFQCFLSGSSYSLSTFSFFLLFPFCVILLSFPLLHHPFFLSSFMFVSCSLSSFSFMLPTLLPFTHPFFLLPFLPPFLPFLPSFLPCFLKLSSLLFSSSLPFMLPFKLTLFHFFYASFQSHSFLFLYCLIGYACTFFFISSFLVSF